MNKHALSLLFVILILSVFGASGQGKISIHSDPVLDSLIEANATINKELNSMEGYRIQIYFGSARKGAQDARTKFLQLYPETEAYLLYQQPYFKVRVGDYRTKFEAQSVYQTLMKEFENVFIVPDKINLPRL